MLIVNIFINPQQYYSTVSALIVSLQFKIYHLERQVLIPNKLYKGQ